MTNLAEKYIEIVKQRNPGEPEFQQAVEEVLRSLEPVWQSTPNLRRPV